MTTRSAPVLLVLGTDPGNRLDPTATRRFAAALVRAASTAGAHLVVQVTGAVGDAIDAAASEGDRHAVRGHDKDKVVSQVLEIADSERVVVVVIGGNHSTVEVLLDRRAAAWPVLAVQYSGGLAGQLAAVRRQPYSSPVVEGDELARLSERSIVPVAVDAALEHRVVWEFDDADVVKRILARRESYDRTAQRLQRNAHRVTVGILGLGVIAVFLAIFDRELGTSGTVHDFFRWVLIVLPAVVAALVALDGVTAAGKRWVVIRAACEAIKREIFVWRTRSGVYKASAIAANSDHPSSATELLVVRVASIEAQLMASIASVSAMFVAVPDDYVDANAYDDGLSCLDASRYLQLRLDDQLSYYRRKMAKVQPQRRAYQVLAIVAGAAGSILAAADASIWVPVAFAIGTALGAYAKHRQLDTTILGFGGAVAALVEIRTRWDARPAALHTDEAYEQLVCDVEDALELEQGNWAAQMKLGLDTPLPRTQELGSVEPVDAADTAVDIELSTFASPTTSPGRDGADGAPAGAPAPLSQSTSMTTDAPASG